jgi:hypothetical protein
MSAVAAILHLAIIFVGASWYRLFGAGERMARLSESGHWYPTLLTSLITLVLTVWAVYAVSAAGLVPLMPLAKPVLCLITAIYLLRGLAIIPILVFTPERASVFWFLSSAVCLLYGAAHFIGLAQVWTRLS